MAVADSGPGGIVPLERGDRLTRDEFERRYRAMPEVRKAELVEGVVYLPTPTRFEQHAESHSHVVTWLGVYVAATPGVRMCDNATVRLDLDNEVQPDALLRLPELVGGAFRINDEGYFAGPPELIFEVASSSASYDLHDKMKVYRRAGVREYLTWRLRDKELTLLVLDGTQYQPIDRA